MKYTNYRQVHLPATVETPLQLGNRNPSYKSIMSHNSSNSNFGDNKHSNADGIMSPKLGSSIVTDKLDFLNMKLSVELLNNKLKRLNNIIKATPNNNNVFSTSTSNSNFRNQYTFLSPNKYTSNSYANVHKQGLNNTNIHIQEKTPLVQKKGIQFFKGVSQTATHKPLKVKDESSDGSLSDIAGELASTIVSPKNEQCDMIYNRRLNFKLNQNEYDSVFEQYSLSYRNNSGRNNEKRLRSGKGVNDKGNVNVKENNKLNVLDKLCIASNKGICYVNKTFTEVKDKCKDEEKIDIDVRKDDKNTDIKEDTINEKKENDVVIEEKEDEKNKKEQTEIKLTDKQKDEKVNNCEQQEKKEINNSNVKTE